MEAEEQPIHPAVDLLLRRMESHPEEFVTDGAWAHHYQQFKTYWNATEKRLFATKMREIRMQAMHEKLMDNLCNKSPAPSKAAKSIGIGSATPIPLLRVGAEHIDEELINAMRKALNL